MVGALARGERGPWQAFTTTATKLPIRVPCFAIAAGCRVVSARRCQKRLFATMQELAKTAELHNKLTWLVSGGDPAARSHRVEQFTAL
jgi:hypothetical protein